jgi:superoxide reductase
MSTKIMQVYRCNVCGNIVEMLHAGDGDLICCAQPMVLYVENTTDASREKHVPVVEKVTGGIKVKIGSAPHPMEAKHYIEWIEVIDGNNVCRKALSPGDKPEAVFTCCCEPASVIVRALCNIHGLWKA